MKILLPNNIELYYKKVGQGDPLLLLHGNGDSHKELEKLGLALSSNYTVYLIDSRDHGKSMHTNKYFVYEDLAEDIDSYFDDNCLYPSYTITLSKTSPEKKDLFMPQKVFVFYLHCPIFFL